MELNQQRFSSYQEACQAARFYATELDRVVADSEIAGQMVTITGEGIVMPTLVHDANLGSVDISTNEIKSSDDDPLAEQSVSGEFFGFTSYGMPMNDEKTVYRAVIGYQVAVITKLNLPNFNGTLMAYGPIDSSTYEFLEDRKIKDAAEAIETLTNIDDPSTADIIQQIDDLLSKQARFEQKNLHQVARLIRQQLGEDNQYLTDQHRNALLDLVKARLGLYSSEFFIIDAISSIETTVYQSKYNIHGAGDGRVIVKGVTFAPYYWKNRDDWTVRPDQQALSIIIERSDHNNKPTLTSVPFEKIRALWPVRDIMLDDE